MKQNILMSFIGLWMLVTLLPTNATTTVSEAPPASKDTACNSNPVESTWETDDSKSVLYMSIPDEQASHIPDSLLRDLDAGDFVQTDDMEFPKDFCDQLGINFPHTLKAGHYKVCHMSKKYVVSFALNTK